MSAAVSFIPSFHHSMERPWSDGNWNDGRNFIPSFHMSRGLEWNGMIIWHFGGFHGN